LHLAQAVSQTVGASSFMPRWNGSSFITALNCFMRLLFGVVGIRRKSRRDARRSFLADTA
jgi:hypothetical protein